MTRLRIVVDDDAIRAVLECPAGMDDAEIDEAICDAIDTAKDDEDWDYDDVFDILYPKGFRSVEYEVIDEYGNLVN